MLVEFWLAGWFGRAWLHVHSSLRPKLGDLPGECGLVARGEQMPAGRLWRAQDFAVRVWWRFAMAVLLLLLPPAGVALGIMAQLRWHAAETAVAWLFYAIAAVVIVALAQAGLIRYRSSQNRLWWTKDKSSPEEPLPAGSDGLPRRSDFWLVSLLAAAAFLILVYASTRSPHH
jgi:uncharacterized membrane protein YhaH (DUF805 family)